MDLVEFTTVIIRCDPVRLRERIFGYNRGRFEIRGGARVVEWDSLENCCGLRSTEGSNPSLSAEVRLYKVGLFLLNH